MKKYLIILICLVFLTGCDNKSAVNSNGDNLMEVTDNYSEIIRLSASDLCNIYIDNNVEFVEKYLGANVSFNGHISRIESGFTINNSDTKYTEFTFEEGIIATTESNSDISDLKPGDSLNIKGTISSGENCDITNYIKVDVKEYKK